jgi:hypothetical protein
MNKTLAIIFGIVFVIFGLLGFFNNPVLGVFKVDAMLNIVYIILGIVLIFGARKNSPMALKVVAAVFLILAVLGFVMGTETKLLSLLTINYADNWLHLGLAIILFASSMAGEPASKTTPPSLPS